MRTNGIFSAIRWTLDGLNAQVKRLDAISENIANAEKAPDANGKVYQRKVVVPRKGASNRIRRFSQLFHLKLRRSNPDHLNPIDPAGSLRPNDSGDIIKVVEARGEKLVYNPGHPRADENGYVRMPDINVVEEMVDLIAASRSYEANITVMDAAKKMAKNALNI